MLSNVWKKTSVGVLGCISSLAYLTKNKLEFADKALAPCRPVDNGDDGGVQQAFDGQLVEKVGVGSQSGTHAHGNTAQRWCVRDGLV